MVCQAVGQIPEYAAQDSHRYSFFSPTVPGRYGNRYEVEDKKAKLVTGNVIKQTQHKKDRSTCKHSRCSMPIKGLRMRVAPSFY